MSIEAESIEGASKGLATRIARWTETGEQFSREYKNLFGAPPMKDIKSLRESVAV